MDKIQILKGLAVGFLANGLGLFLVGIIIANSSGRNDSILSV